jgi:hypothetical protein
MVFVAEGITENASGGSAGFALFVKRCCNDNERIGYEIKYQEVKQTVPGDPIISVIPTAQG